MLIAQISDTHISTPGSVNDRVLRTPEHLARAVAHLNRVAPDLVLVTGDLVEAGRAEEYARLREILAPLAMPAFVIPGNHDDREQLRRAFADHAYLPRGGAFIQYVVDDWPVRLVAVDTLVPGAPGGHLCAERLAWLEARLAEAPRRPTIVLMHHPPLISGIVAMDGMGLDARDELAAVIRRHPQVERIVCGHLHRAITQRFAGTIVATCPSTAHQVALELAPSRRLSLVMEPPVCLLHWWSEAGLVTHSSFVVDRHPRLTIFDGERWAGADVEAPAGFHEP